MIFELISPCRSILEKILDLSDSLRSHANKRETIQKLLPVYKYQFDNQAKSVFFFYATLSELSRGLHEISF